MEYRHKKESNPITGGNMSKHEGPYAKWNKTRKELLDHGITYMQNL